MTDRDKMFSSVTLVKDKTSIELRLTTTPVN